MIVTRWHIAKTSSSRCEMNMTAAPSLRRVATTSKSRWTSTSVRAAVGSSMMMILALKEIALAISTICWSATDSPRATRFGDICTPRRSNTSFERRVISERSIRRPERRWVTPHEDVLGDAQVGEQCRLLVDHRDARLACVDGTGESDRSTRPR